jgi:hypothetical protein
LFRFSIAHHAFERAGQCLCESKFKPKRKEEPKKNKMFAQSRDVFFVEAK